MSSIHDTLEFIVKGIVPDPNTITIESSEIDDTVNLLIVSPPDITGQIIGKQGKVIKAIRTILTITYPQQKFTLEFKN